MPARRPAIGFIIVSQRYPQCGRLCCRADAEYSGWKCLARILGSAPVTAYISPNKGKAYGVMADAAPPNYIAIVDLQALLNAPRIPGTHTVEPTFDLVANGVVVYVAAH